jgi:hypothetical protein
MMSRSGPFTNDEEMTLGRMWLGEETITEISKVLGRTYASIQTKADHMGCPGRHGEINLKRYKIRECIRCKTIICSEGANERMCKPCRRRSPDDVLGFGSPVSTGGPKTRRR